MVRGSQPVFAIPSARADDAPAGSGGNDISYSTSPWPAAGPKTADASKKKILQLIRQQDDSRLLWAAFMTASAAKV
jgi:hypothetical protein